jgi:hypothetical protein
MRAWACFALAGLWASIVYADIDATWNAGVGAWEDPTQWSGVSSAYPNNDSTNTYSVSIGAGSATVSSDITIKSLSLSGGTLTGDGTLNVGNPGGLPSASLNWTAGRIEGAGILNSQGFTRLIFDSNSPLYFGQRTVHQSSRSNHLDWE